MAAFTVQLVAGLIVIANPDREGAVKTIAIVAIVCFLIGIARAWELIGGPSIGLGRELSVIMRGEDQPVSDPEAD